MKPCDLSRECRVIRVVMLVSFVPICLLLFYAATYSARVTLASWRCVPRQLTSKTSHAIRKSEAEAEEHRPLANEKIHFHNDDHNVSNRTTKTVRRLANGDAVPTATGGYCDTIFDQSRGNVLSFLGKRNTIMIVRSVSLANTFLTYCSAWIATYNLHFLPLLWLAVVSFSSFFVTLEVSILTGPLSCTYSDNLLIILAIIACMNMYLDI